MAEINREETGWVLSRIWLDALEETARDFHGNWPKMFCSRAYEHATDAWLKVLATEYDLEVKATDTIFDAVKNYIELGLKAGLFENASDINVQDAGPNKVEITVYNCPYRKTCLDLINSGFSVKDLTCARIGCFRAAVRSIADLDTNYEVTRFSSEVCEGFVERV
jgi:hypothetical protein